MRFVCWLAVLVAALAIDASPAWAQGVPPEIGRRGEEVYGARCASCHENPQDRTPTRNSITHSRSADFLLRVLNEGVMQQQASTLSQEDRVAVSAYLMNVMPGAGATIDPNANRCRGAVRPVALDGPSWNGWGGRGTTNARYQPNPGLRAAEVSRLKVKWAFLLPGGAANQPTIARSRVFAASVAGIVYSLDGDTGCTVWAFDVGAAVRTPITLGQAGRVIAAFFGDNKGRFWAVDARSGRLIWKVEVDPHPMIRLTGAPALFEGRLYVPVSSYEEAPDPNYRCCAFRGSLVALDAADGRLIWKTYTIDRPAQPLADGHRRGPSGVAIWHAPTIDVKRRRIYVATGNSYTEPTVETSNAALALDLDTGARRWVTQIHKADVSVAGCVVASASASRRNCPASPGPDFDLGGSPLLVTTRDGQDHLLITSKSGEVFGLDVEGEGKILWRTKLGRGSSLGGVQWGGASDGDRVYLSVSDGGQVRQRGPGADLGPGRPGLSAISPSTGDILWNTPTPKAVCAWVGPCVAAQPSAPAVTPDVVFAGAWDGHLRAYASTDGRILWDFDAGRSFTSVNGGEATGGSIDLGGQVVAGGLLLVTSGARNAQPGNVLLALTVDGR